MSGVDDYLVTDPGWKGGGADRRIWFSVLDQPLPSPLNASFNHNNLFPSPSPHSSLNSMLSESTFPDFLRSVGFRDTRPPPGLETSC